MIFHKRINNFSILVLLLFITNVGAQSHGDHSARTRNDHTGNRVRLTFRNHGSMAYSDSEDNTQVFGAEWPINSGLAQLGIAANYVQAELNVFEKMDEISGDSIFFRMTPVVWCETGPNAWFPSDELGNFQGFEPLPGYLNENNPDPFHRVAMSHQPITWPLFWPDKMEDAVDPGWRNKWNGYFGKGIQNADQESYFAVDDYNYKRKVAGVPIPLADPDDPSRAGLGLRELVRGLQWSNPDAQDAIFWIYDVKNIGQTRLPKTVFGMNVGGSLGATVAGISETSDDVSQFYREINLAVQYDWDNLGTGGYTPVPWIGFAYLETPGNALDGIDNDGDGINGGPIITTDDFIQFYNVGDPIILINYNSDNYERTVSTMPAGGVTIRFNEENFHLPAGQTLEEIPRNSMDDNLNGIIDENDGVVLDSTVGRAFYIYIRSTQNQKDYRRIDYFTGAGRENLMIDERRDDGIDNDGDWDPLNDDVGLDGVSATGDEGEGDGMPTPGRGDLPGEPNIDRVDVSESDQIGLTSFIYYIWSTLTYGNDDQMWEVSRPGYFDNRLSNVDADYISSSGYFPLMPGRNAAFSLALVMGWDEAQIRRNTQTVQRIYDANYNFAVAPSLPTLKAIPGDGKVTLYWDDVAEKSLDRFLKDYDFEGYKIYRATDPGFSDYGQITDGYGDVKFSEPLIVFDKIDDVFGFYPIGSDGIQFYLGEESGLTHSYVDEGVTNGVTYFYAVTAYDKGSLENDILPTETNKFIAISQSGEIINGINVAVVTPTVPAAGYIPPGFNIQPQRTTSSIRTSGAIGVGIVEPENIPDGGKFEIEFMDISSDERDNNLDGLIDSEDPDEFLPIETSGLVLRDISNASNPVELETVWFKEYRVAGDTTVKEITNLYEDNDDNYNTLRFVSNGMEFFVYNPSDGVYSDVENEIENGVKWSASIDPENTYPIQFGRWDNELYVPGISYPRQFKMVFYNEVVDTIPELELPRVSGGTRRVREQEANFKIFDLVTGEQVKYAYRAGRVSRGASNAPEEFFKAADELWFYEEGLGGEQIITYYLHNLAEDDTTFENFYGHHLGTGDSLYLYPDFQFVSGDKFEFTTFGASLDVDAAKDALDKIRVVPNPYVVGAGWEPQNQFSNGRGERKIIFNHLPAKCTIRIYTVSGTLVQTIEHDDALTDGSAEWNLLSKDNMEIAYGLYIYHVDAPGIGEHINRFIVIK